MRICIKMLLTYVELCRKLGKFFCYQFYKEFKIKEYFNKVSNQNNNFVAKKTLFLKDL